MAFGHASKPTRKYALGVRETPHGVPRSAHIRFEGHGIALDQMYKAYCFQSRLIGLEQIRRDRINAIVNAHPAVAPVLAMAEAEQATLGELRDRLSAANSAARQRQSDPELVTQINEQKEIATATWANLAEARAATYHLPAVRAEILLIDMDIRTHKSAARTRAVECGLYWPTSLQVAARVKTSGPAPHFQKWGGEETISIQFQRKPDKDSPKVPVLDSKGEPRIHPRSGKPMMAHESGASLSTTDLFAPNSLCWIERLPPTIPYRPEKDPTRKHVVVHFRVASDGKGRPIWAKLPTVLHREFPEGEVKWAHLTRRKIGTHYRWDVMFDIAREAWTEHPAGADRATEGVVAVALGWRQIDGAVRVAEWVGSDGVQGTIRVPDDLVAQWRSIESLQSARDREFDRWKDGVLNFVRAQPNLPSEWVQQTATLLHWNSPYRLTELVEWWRSHRLPGDEVAYAAAEGELIRNRPAAHDTYTGGRKQDRHLCDMQANRRARLLGWRKDFYRQIAIDLSYQYKSVIIAEIDWHEIAANPEVEDADEPVNKLNRGLAACASLRDQLTHYMTEARVPAPHITDTCAVCKRRVSHPGRGRWIRCERCGGEDVDRAVNAARNMLFRHLGADVVI
jgi:hypothetical protein